MRLSFYILILFIFSKYYLAFSETLPETLMWEINSENSTAKVFLLGSIHYADSSIYPLHKAIENSFDSSDILILEIVIDEVNPFLMMEHLTFKDERTLETSIPADSYKKVSEMFEEMGLTKKTYNKFKPWFALLVLQTDSFKGSGLTAAEGIDMYFLGKARSSGKEVDEIESIEAQIKLIDELGDFTGDYFKLVLESSDTTAVSVEELITAWKKGDEKVIEKISNKGNETAEFAEVMDKLNYQRNIEMMKKVEEYLKTDKTFFIIVGAAHVVGEKGLVQLLKNTNKYKIKRY